MIDFYEFRMALGVGVVFGIVGAIVEHSAKAGLVWGAALAGVMVVVLILDGIAHR